MKWVSSNFFHFRNYVKKNAAGVAVFLMLLDGDHVLVSKDLSVKTVVFYLQITGRNRIKNRFVWFKKWVLERQTFKTLTRDCGCSKDTLQRTFYTLLEKAPRVKIIKRENVNLRMDATYFSSLCLLAYQDNLDGYTQLIRFSDGEHYTEIKEDLDNLIKLGVRLESKDTAL